VGLLAVPVLRDDEQIAVALLLFLPALLIGAYIVITAVFGDRFSGAAIAVVCIFISAANFRARAYSDKSIDWQVGLKLLALGLLLATAVVFMSYAFNRLRLGRLFYEWLLFFAWLVVASAYSESVGFALTCSISFLICYFYAVYMTIWLSRIRAIEIMMLVALLMCVGSIFVYFVVPSMGRMQAWTEGATFGDTGRMKGLTGSANAIGMIAALAIVLSILYYRSFGAFGRRLAIVLIPSALACLVLSNNRSSMLAIAVAIWFAFLCRGDTGFKIVLSAAAALFGGLLLMTFSDEIFSLLSRSGKADEITSATGRSLIWSVVLELSAQRPLLGYGYTSALSLLPTDPRLFNVAAHAHNMFLELLFAGGIVLLGIFLYVSCRTFVVMYQLRAINEAAVFMFFMTRGLTEAGPFGGMTGYTSVAFVVTVALVISKSVEARARAPALRAFTSRRGAPRLQPSRI
jgi:exopolysaccharide production protein ExoQ